MKGEIKSDRKPDNNKTLDNNNSKCSSPSLYSILFTKFKPLNKPRN